MKVVYWHNIKKEFLHWRKLQIPFLSNFIVNEIEHTEEHTECN